MNLSIFVKKNVPCLVKMSAFTTIIENAKRDNDEPPKSYMDNINKTTTKKQTLHDDPSVFC